MSDIPSGQVNTAVPTMKSIVQRVQTAINEGQTHKNQIPEWVNVTLLPNEAQFIVNYFSDEISYFNFVSQII